MGDLNIGSCLNCEAAPYPEVGTQCANCGWFPPCPWDLLYVPLTQKPCSKKPCCKEKK